MAKKISSSSFWSMDVRDVEFILLDHTTSATAADEHTPRLSVCGAVGVRSWERKRRAVSGPERVTITLLRAAPGRGERETEPGTAAMTGTGAERARSLGTRVVENGAAFTALRPFRR